MAAFRYRGREIQQQDILYIRALIERYPQDSRRKLSTRLCEAWKWRQSNGVLRDMTCRGLLLMLERAGQIKLPPVSYVRHNPLANRARPEPVRIDATPIGGRLCNLQPLEFELVRRTEKEPLWNSLLEQHHYLGYEQPVGEHLKYLVLGQGRRPVACLAWSSAYWSSAMWSTSAHGCLRSRPLVSLRWSAAFLYAAGFDLEWSRVAPEGRFLRLPAYPWRHQRYWIDEDPGPHAMVLARTDASEGHAGDHQLALDGAPSPRVEGPPAAVDVLDELRQRVAGLLGVAPQEVDIDRPLVALGLDSITARRASCRQARNVGALGRRRRSTTRFISGPISGCSASRRRVVT